jgi:hypothetical protein
MNRRGYGWLTLRLIITLCSVFLLTFAFLRTTGPSRTWLVGVFLVWIFAGVETIRLAFDRSAYLWRLEAELKENRLEDFHLLIAPFVFLASFALVCRELSVFFPSLFTVPTADAPFSQSHLWVVFTIDQAARALLLDFFETFRIHLSNIQYASNVWICSLMFLYKTVLALVFWRFIFLFYEHWQATLERTRSGT